jgi:hypothetical protein
MRISVVISILLSLFLVACFNDGQQESSSSLTPLEATATARAGDDGPATPVAIEVQARPTITAGQSDDGTYYLGESSAPVTLIDYSDFL